MTKERVALITGAGSGIGRATALRLAELDHRVVLCGREVDPLRRTLEAAGGGGMAVSCDIGEERAVADLVDRVERECGRLDVLVNCAAVSVPGSLQELDVTAAERLWRVNVLGPAALTRACVPLLQLASAEPGSWAAPVVVNVSTSTGGRGWPGSGMYAASKAALDSLTRTWAVELAPSGIRVVGIAPGAVETPMASRAGGGAERVAQLREWQRAHTPLARIAEPSEIADAIAYVASAQASFLTGAIIPVDGGAAVA